MNMSDLWR